MKGAQSVVHSFKNGVEHLRGIKESPIFEEQLTALEFQGVQLDQIFLQVIKVNRTYSGNLTNGKRSN